jgi:hypothetical protein
MSSVARRTLAVLSTPVPSSWAASVGSLLTWLMTPPVEPRPKRIEDGPFNTSTSWVTKGSR